MSTKLPWDDCKVAFSVKNTEKIWEYIWCYTLPVGWEYIKSDGTGSRDIVIFRVEGRLTKKDGVIVSNILKEIESL